MYCSEHGYVDSCFECEAEELEGLIKIYSLSKAVPEKDGDECLVWMGSWWRHCVWCKDYNKFLTGDMELLKAKVDLWFYPPEAKDSQ